VAARAPVPWRTVDYCGRGGSGVFVEALGAKPPDWSDDVPECHDTPEICVFHDGGGTFLLRGSRCAVGRGTVLIIPPGTPHSYRVDPAQPYANTNVSYRLGELGGLAPLLAPYHSLLTLRPARVPAGRFLRPLETAAADLAEEYRGTDWARADRLRLRFGDLLLLVARCLVAASPASGAAPPASAWTYAQAMTDYLERHRTDPDLDLRRLAAHVGLGAAYACRIFRLYTGVTPMRFLTRLRLETAEALLATTEPLAVAEVARRSGFASLRSMERAFHAWRGDPPAAFRSACLRQRAVVATAGTPIAPSRTSAPDGG
jgi:AraC-like DNA-binding protein